MTAVGTYLFLMLALVALGVVDLSEGASGDAIASGIAALVAFFIGGVTTGATSMWQGADDGVLHGIVMWFVALVALVVLGAVGGGVALGALDTSDTFDQFSADEVDTEQANEDAEEQPPRHCSALLWPSAPPLQAVPPAPRCGPRTTCSSSALGSAAADD